jgi:hypothetical protein
MGTSTVPVALLLIASIGVANAADKAPPTSKGKPDLQGIWTGGTLTPFERPAQLADKPQLSQSELAAHNDELTKKFWAFGHRPDDVGRDNDAFLDQDLQILPSGQTSLVVYPTDGRVPVQPWAEKRAKENRTKFDSYETMSQWDRCITRGPTELFPVVYNNAYQIMQTDRYIVIVSEMIHDARVVPLDGNEHIDSRIRSWNGDSRGHWEGSTLVVDTRNFNGKGWIVTGLNGGRLTGVPYTEDLQLTERFTRVDAKTLKYEITVTDPSVYTSPWTLSFPLTLDDNYQMFEYACHEGNQSIESTLRGARTQEAEAKKREVAKD